LGNQYVVLAAGIEAARRSFDATELLKRAELAGSKRNSTVAALQVIFLTQQLAIYSGIHK
jgi:hypothetical protein